jgi:hypothetical protein
MRRGRSPIKIPAHAGIILADRRRPRAWPPPVFNIVGKVIARRKTFAQDGV